MDKSNLAGEITGKSSGKTTGNVARISTRKVAGRLTGKTSGSTALLIFQTLLEFG